MKPLLFPPAVPAMPDQGITAVHPTPIKKMPADGCRFLCRRPASADWPDAAAGTCGRQGIEHGL